MAEHVNVRQRGAALARGNGGEDFISRAARVGVLVRKPLFGGKARRKVRRQGRAEPSTQNGDDDFAIGRAHDLFLKAVMRAVKAFLPEH